MHLLLLQRVWYIGEAWIDVLEMMVRLVPWRCGAGRGAKVLYLCTRRATAPESSYFQNLQQTRSTYSPVNPEARRRHHGCVERLERLVQCGFGEVGPQAQKELVGLNTPWSISSAWMF